MTTQTIAATANLGPGKTGLAIGYRVLNLNGTTYAAFSTTGVAETSTAGTYRKAGGVVAPLAGGYIVWGTAGEDLIEATIPANAAGAIPALAKLGPGKTGLAIGYRVLNLDGTTYAAFSTTGVTETGVAGTYRKAGGVVAPLAGGYIVWGTAGEDIIEATIPAELAGSGGGSLGEGATYDDLLDDMPPALLVADWTEISSAVADRSMLNALRFLRNKWSIGDTTLTVTKEDDTTAAWTATVTGTSGADPVTGFAPS